TTSVKPGATAVTQVSAAAEDSSAAFRLTTLTVRRRSRFLTLFSFKWLAKFPQPGTPGGEVGFGGTKFRALEASNLVWAPRPVLSTVNPLGRAAARSCGAGRDAPQGSCGDEKLDRCRAGQIVLQRRAEDCAPPATSTNKRWLRNRSNYLPRKHGIASAGTALAFDARVPASLDAVLTRPASDAAHRARSLRP